MRDRCGIPQGPILFGTLLHRAVVRYEWLRSGEVYARRWLFADSGQPLSEGRVRTGDLGPRPHRQCPGREHVNFSGKGCDHSGSSRAAFKCSSHSELHRPHTTATARATSAETFSDRAATGYGSDGCSRYMQPGRPTSHQTPRQPARTWHRMSSAGARRCKRGHPSGALILKPCKFAVQPTCDRRATADRQGAWSMYTRSGA